MAGKRFELKVGVFVLFCLLLLGALVLSFSKGFSLVKNTYDVYLRTSDVGGIKQRASVLMAGVNIGYVKDIQLGDGGKFATLTLCIKKQYPVYRDADFLIEQAGLLGDQYISIVPKQNNPPALEEGDRVETAPATDFKQMLRSAAGLVERLDEVAASLQSAAGRVDRTLLSETNIGAISRAMTHTENLTARANLTMERLDSLVATNSPPINAAVSNIESFSLQLKGLGAELDSLVATNKDEIARAARNLENATATADQLLADLRAGKGVAGGLLRDESLRQQVTVVVTNLATMTANFSELASNLNRHGIFYKPRTPRTNLPSIYTGRMPFP